MNNNYRVITISILNGSTLDVAEFVNLIEADDWARGQQAARWDAHCIYVAMENGEYGTYVMGRMRERS